MSKKIYRGRIKHYCRGCGKLLKTEWQGVYESELSGIISVDSDGFAHVNDMLCGECQSIENAHTIKKAGKAAKILGIVAAVVAVLCLVFVGGGYLLNNFVFSSSDTLEKAYAKKLEKFEKDERVKKNVDDGKPAGETVTGYIAGCFAKEDYVMHAYLSEGTVEIQKTLSGLKTEYYFKFNKGFKELENKVYALIDGLIYESGKEKIAYRESSESYAPLKERLESYLPQSVCLKQKFTSQSTLMVDGKAVIDVLYSSVGTTYCDWDKSRFYEKGSDIFVNISFYEAGKCRKTISAPRLSDCKIEE